MKKIKLVLSIISFISSIIIAFIALYLPPTGIIDSSVLWFTSQCLLFTTSILGISIDLGKYGKSPTYPKI